MVISCSENASIIAVTEVAALASASSSCLRCRVTGSEVRACVEPAWSISARIRAGSASRAGDVVPDDGVEVVGADRLVAADPAAFVAVVIGAEAPVVVDLVARRGGAWWLR